jgi:hypothetical protein
MRVSELEDAKLDYWVGKVNGWEMAITPDGKCIVTKIGIDDWLAGYSPSTDWSQGGPIIGRTKMEFETVIGDFFMASIVAGNETKYIEHIGIGKTHLIAAMRCYVASKFGEEVPDAE